jgi:aspartyl-tRNA(Asn)/glutamyl-tRNA(Gln) amidotransferase subunit C
MDLMRRLRKDVVVQEFLVWHVDFGGCFMSVTSVDVKKVSNLARIRIEESKIDELCNDLNSILNFVEQLNEIDGSRLQALDEDGRQHAHTSPHERDDVAKACDPAVMDNAPQKECNMFVVPKVVV